MPSSRADRMKDSIHLLFVGAVLAVAAWTLWHYGAHEALDTVSTIALVTVIADNVRLRRALREKHKVMQVRDARCCCATDSNVTALPPKVWPEGFT